MDSLQDEFLSLSEELSGEYRDGGGAITDFFILGAGNVDQDFGRRVVDVDRLKNGGAIVRHRDVLALRWVADALENFVHALGAKGGLDQVRNCDCANK